MAKTKEEQKEYSRLWHLKNRERRLLAQKEWYQKNKGIHLPRTKAYGNANKEKRSAKRKERYQERRSIELNQCRAWAKANRGKKSAAYKRYMTNKSNAMPKWLTEEQKAAISFIYDICPKGSHVDHVVPLNGDSVCGLHVPWNLQHLEASANLSKGNRL